MRKLHFLILLCTMVLLGACNSDIEEFRFKGNVIGGRMCTSSQLGYVFELLDTTNIGVDYTIGDRTYHNVVIGYKPPKLLYDGDTVTGVAYMTKSYAALNCYGIIEKDLPEMIILSID